MYTKYPQKDFNNRSNKNQIILIILALTTFIVSYVLASNDEFRTMQADEEFHSQNQSNAF